MGGGPSQTTRTSETRDPWSGQQPYLLEAFRNAQDTYNRNTAQGAYTGDYVAAPSQQQYDAYGNAVTQGYNAQNYNNGLLAHGAENYSSGTAGSTTAMNNLANFGSTDQTQANIDSARQYVAGMDIPGAVRAGMLQANQNASENAIPNIYRQAAASGGVNSDRAAISQGIVERGLAQQAAGLNAQLTNSAYAQGLQSAQTDNAQGILANQQAGNIGDMLTRLGYASQTSGINNQTTINAQTTGGANGATALDQQTLNNLMAQYNGGQNFDWSQLQNLMGIVGSANWGGSSTGTSTTQQNPSLLQNIGSGFGIASALFCDANEKTIYGPTGGSWRGITPEYFFSYNLDHTNRLHRGPIAQVLEATHPHAVTTIGGIKVIMTDRL